MKYPPQMCNQVGDVAPALDNHIKIDRHQNFFAAELKPSKIVTDLSNINFHSKEAESQFIKHLMVKLGADAIATSTQCQIKNVHFKDNEDKNILEKIFENLISSICLKNVGADDSISVHPVAFNSTNYETIRMPMPETHSWLILIYKSTSNEIVNEHHKWLEENGKFVRSLMQFFDQFNETKGNAQEECLNLNAHTIVDNATSEQKETLEQLTALFENQLLKRQVKKSSDDLWDEFGRGEFKKRLWFYVESNRQILFVLPAFPFKSSNRETKVLGALPDMGERLALQKLERFMISIKQIYAPGGRLVMFSDGRVYCDIFRISDDVTSKFKMQIRRTYLSDLISWSDLDVFFSSFNDDDKRVALVNLFGTTQENIDLEIKNDSDFREVYCGFKKFMTEEIVLPEGIGNRKGRLIVRAAAQGLMMRNYSYGRLMKILFPNHVRLSIHPSRCLTKFSVNMVGETDWGTPWHNCALHQPDGSWSLIRKKTAEAKCFQLLNTDDGLPYYLNDSGKKYTERL